jgi:CDP-diacylglycerol--glycerol-3-phosphate 3-phosphatidyltransferase
MKTVAHTRSYYIINGITLYRVIAAPVLLVLLFKEEYVLFKWLLLLSFFTDFIDGYLARKFKVTSVLGTRLDSVGDDLTVLVAMAGLFRINTSFIKEQQWFLIILFVLFLVQAIAAFLRYSKMTSFHTYLAKLAAFAQGIFLLLSFFLDRPVLLLFYAAFLITLFELIEEIIIVCILPQWETNVKGLYWVLRKQKEQMPGATRIPADKVNA